MQRLRAVKPSTPEIAPSLKAGLPRIRPSVGAVASRGGAWALSRGDSYEDDQGDPPK